MEGDWGGVWGMGGSLRVEVVEEGMRVEEERNDNRAKGRKEMGRTGMGWISRRKGRKKRRKKTRKN